MMFSFVQRSGQHEVFAPTAFDSQIGKTIPVRTDSGSTPGTVVAAKVSTDGKQVELTVEVEEQSPVAEIIGSVGRPMSFGLPQLTQAEDRPLRRNPVRYKGQ